MTHHEHDVRPNEPLGSAHSEKELDRQLDALLAELEVEPAPPALRRRLRRIPRAEGGKHDAWKRLFPGGPMRSWALVPALAVALLAVGIVVMLPDEPPEEEVLRVRQELAVAFSYIDRAGVLTGQEIQSVLGGELRRSIKGNLSRSIPFTEQSRKEETT